MRALPLLLLGACSAGGMPPSAPSVLIDAQAPRFAQATVQGPMISTADAAGRVVVIKFFAKYCKPCRKTLSATEKLRREKRDVVFIGIAEDENVADVRELIAAHALSFPVVHDPTNMLADQFRVRELPRTFVIDRSGRVRWVGGETQDERDLGTAIDVLRAER